MFQLISGMGSLLQKIVPFVLSVLHCVGGDKSQASENEFIISFLLS